MTPKSYKLKTLSDNGLIVDVHGNEVMNQSLTDQCFFIDLIPEANWAHPGLYVCVSPKFLVIQHDWPPHEDCLDIM